MTRSLLVLALGLVPLFWSCESEEAENTALQGSVSRIYPLEYDTIRARLSTGELAIQYVSGREVVVQAIARLEDMPIEGPTTVDLALHGEVSGSIGHTVLPPFLSGTLRLEAYSPTEGASVTGDFDAVLEGDDRNYAVHGDFDVQLEDQR